LKNSRGLRKSVSAIKETKRPGRVYPRKQFKTGIRRQVVAEESFCGVCRLFLKVKERVVDHIVPERVLRRLKLNPHLRINLMVLCRSCSGKKTAVDRRMGEADRVGFLDELRIRRWPITRVLAALKHYKL
jgi:5-methylcytosine-specific restriction endonuclease McrA